jgi:hypothetical protein
MSVPNRPQHTVTYVFDPDGQDVPFAYSVGLAARPGSAWELASTGLPGRLAQAVINGAAAQLVRDNLDPVDGMELDQVLVGYHVRLRRAEDTTKCTGARLAAGPEVPVWQILTPDQWGHFPGDEHYSEAPDAQPLL